MNSSDYKNKMKSIINNTNVKFEDMREEFGAIIYKFDDNNLTRDIEIVFPIFDDSKDIRIKAKDLDNSTLLIDRIKNKQIDKLLYLYNKQPK